MTVTRTIPLTKLHESKGYRVRHTNREIWKRWEKKQNKYEEERKSFESSRVWAWHVRQRWHPASQHTLVHKHTNTTGNRKNTVCLSQEQQQRFYHHCSTPTTTTTILPLLQPLPTSLSSVFTTFRFLSSVGLWWLVPARGRKGRIFLDTLIAETHAAIPMFPNAHTVGGRVDVAECSSSTRRLQENGQHPEMPGWTWSPRLKGLLSTQFVH